LTFWGFKVIQISLLSTIYFLFFSDILDLRQLTQKVLKQLFFVLTENFV